MSDRSQQDDVGVRAARHDRQPALGQDRGQARGVVLDLVGVVSELRLQRLAQADRLRGYDLSVDAALDARKDGGLQLLSPALIPRKDHSAARPAQGLCGGAGDNIGVRYRRRAGAAGHEAGDMRHIDLLLLAPPGGGGAASGES